MSPFKSPAEIRQYLQNQINMFKAGYESYSKNADELDILQFRNDFRRLAKKMVDNSGDSSSGGPYKSYFDDIINFERGIIDAYYQPIKEYPLFKMLLTPGEDGTMSALTEYLIEYPFLARKAIRGITPLMVAASRIVPAWVKPVDGIEDNLSTAKLLLKYGAKIDAQDDFGRTALMYVGCGKVILYGRTYFGRTKLCKFLLDEGASPSIRDHNGNTALDYLKESYKKEPGIRVVSGRKAGEKNGCDILEEAMLKAERVMSKL